MWLAVQLLISVHGSNTFRANTKVFVRNQPYSSEIILRNRTANSPKLISLYLSAFWYAQDHASIHFAPQPNSHVSAATTPAAAILLPAAGRRTPPARPRGKVVVGRGAGMASTDELLMLIDASIDRIIDRSINLFNK